MLQTRWLNNFSSAGMKLSMQSENLADFQDIKRVYEKDVERPHHLPRWLLHDGMTPSMPLLVFWARGTNTCYEEIAPIHHPSSTPLWLTFLSSHSNNFSQTPFLVLLVQGKLLVFQDVIILQLNCLGGPHLRTSNFELLFSKLSLGLELSLQRYLQNIFCFYFINPDLKYTCRTQHWNLFPCCNLLSGFSTVPEKM